MSIKSFDTLVPSLPRDYISIKCSESLQYSERENIDDDSENIDDDSAGNFEKIAQNRLGTMQNKNVDTKLCNKYSLPTTLPNCLHHKNLLDPSHPVFVYSIIPKFEPIPNKICMFAFCLLSSGTHYNVSPLAAYKYYTNIRLFNCWLRLWD